MERPIEFLPGKLYDWLRREAASWVGEGLVDQGQADAILARYEAEEQRDSGGRLVTILAVLGSLLVGTGVILFFASNWQFIPKPAKVSIILTAIVAAYGLGYYLAFEKGSYPRVGRALIFLGSICYGSGIWLIAQIFHISSHFPDGLLIWLLGIAPLVLVCRSLSVLLEVALLLFIWTIAEPVEFNNYNPLFVPVAGLALWLGYRMRSRLTVGAALLAVLAWITAGGLVAFSGSSDFPAPVFMVSAAAGLCLFMLGGIHGWWEKAERWAPMKFPYQLAGLLGYFAFAFLLSFEGVTGGFRQLVHYPAGLWVLFAAVALSCLSAAAFSLARAGGERPRIYEGTLVLAALAVLGVMTVVSPRLSGTAVYAVMNLLLFISTVGFIVVGYLKREEVLINLGLLFFVVDVIARYFDFFWEMLPKSVFFMAGGVLLLVGGFFLERNRRKMLREMRVMQDAA
ncbi:MAG: DUF2157 domain-containing protein [Firmicutes bacterium]|nr:DUF2157 domain-containing protein [Bacillota bacterium]